MQLSFTAGVICQYKKRFVLVLGDAYRAKEADEKIYRNGIRTLFQCCECSFLSAIKWILVKKRLNTLTCKKNCADSKWLKWDYLSKKSG